MPDPPFKGKIGLTPADSVKDFPAQVTAPEGAPNVLIILTDDVGFGASSAFGGPIPTPTMERIVVGRLDRFRVLDKCRGPLIGVAADEAVEILEAESDGPLGGNIDLGQKGDPTLPDGHAAPCQ